MIDLEKLAEMKACRDTDTITRWLDTMSHEDQFEAMKLLMEGEKMDPGMFRSLASYADQAVNMALTEVIDMAEHLGTDQVPVDVLRQLIDQPKTATQVLWNAIDRLGIEFAGADCPDDLSELGDS